VWSDDRKRNTRGSDIYARRVAASGARAGKEFRISGLLAIGTEAMPEVAWSQRSNECLVVRQDTRNFGDRNNDIYGRQVAASGARLGKDFRISGPAAVALDRCPALAWNHVADSCLVVREGARNLGSRGVDICGRRVEG